MDTLKIFSKVKNFPLISTKLVEGLLSGNYRTVFKGPGLEFDEVREYFEGDDARTIDWNVTSRMGSPYSKIFKEERELALFLLIDVSASLLSGTEAVNKQDTANILAALLAASAVYNNDRVGAVFFSDKIEKWVPLMKGKKHVARLIQDMVKLSPKGRGSDLDLAVRTVSESLKRRGICIILSDFRAGNSWRGLSHLSRKHDVIAIKVTDPMDTNYPSSGYIEIRDNETGAVIPGMGRSGKFRRSYQEYWEMQHVFWQRECRRRGIDFFTVDTSADPVSELLKFFSRRKRR